MYSIGNYQHIWLTSFISCEIWSPNFWDNLPLGSILKLSYLFFLKIRNALWQPFLGRLNLYSVCGHFCGVWTIRLLTFSTVAGIYGTMGPEPGSLETSLMPFSNGDLLCCNIIKWLLKMEVIISMYNHDELLFCTNLVMKLEQIWYFDAFRKSWVATLDRVLLWEEEGLFHPNNYTD